jgi:hypothetical protein
LKPVQQLHIAHCARDDPVYGEDVENAIEAIVRVIA